MYTVEEVRDRLIDEGFYFTFLLEVSPEDIEDLHLRGLVANLQEAFLNVDEFFANQEGT